jgi:hypothetical protein
VLVRAQLLASIFYEELRRELRRCPDPEREILITAVDQCGRAAIAHLLSTQPFIQIEVRGATNCALMRRRKAMENYHPLTALAHIDGLCAGRSVPGSQGGCAILPSAAAGSGSLVS